MMVEQIFSYISVEGLLLFIVVLAVFNWLSVSDIQRTNAVSQRELLEKLDELRQENEQIFSELYLIKDSLNDLEDLVTPNHVKINRLVKQGFPEDVAIEAVTCGEVGGYKIGQKI